MRAKKEAIQYLENDKCYRIKGKIESHNGNQQCETDDGITKEASLKR